MSPVIAFDIAVMAQKVKVVNEDRCDLKKLMLLYVPLWSESRSIPPLKGRPALFELLLPGHQTFYRVRVA